MERPGRRRTCLVAVDGSRPGVDALVWGLRHAAAHDMDVEVLTVWPPHDAVLVHEVPGHFCAPRWNAHVAQQHTVREAVEAVRDAPAVASTLENGDPAEAILHASYRHDLVVLGSDSPSTGRRLTQRVVDEAPCDVVVVRTTGASRSRQRQPSSRPPPP